MMLPSILIVNNYLRGVRERVDRIAYRMKRQVWLRSADREFLDSRMAAYRASDLEELREKLQVHPVSIVLAQAALESGWGSSRFFIEGNNVFGIWHFGGEHDRLEAAGTREGNAVYLKKYDNILYSILDYYRTIARGPYSKFRSRRGLTDDPVELTALLYNYSESRGEYVSRLRSVIRDAGLYEYDDYQIDPDYLK
jgi:Bax protein